MSPFSPFYDENSPLLTPGSSIINILAGLGSISSCSGLFHSVAMCSVEFSLTVVVHYQDQTAAWSIPGLFLLFLLLFFCYSKLSKCWVILLLIQHLFHPHHIAICQCGKGSKALLGPECIDYPEYMLVFSVWKSCQDIFQHPDKLSVDIYRKKTSSV